MNSSSDKLNNNTATVSLILIIIGKKQLKSYEQCVHVQSANLLREGGREGERESVYM